MLTRTHFRHTLPEPIAQEKQATQNFKKGDCITLAGKIYIIMAKLQSDAESPVTYSICDENLLNPKFGITLDSAEYTAIEALSENIQRRAKNFL